MPRFARFTVAVIACMALLSSAAREAYADTTIGWFEIRGALGEKPDPFAVLTGASAPTLLDTVDALRAAGDREDLDAVVIRLREPELTTTQIEELGEAIYILRLSGKKVYVFSEIYGPAELLLGSYADDVIMQSGGAVSLPGLHVEEMYFGDTLSWLGAKMDYVQIGAYKGASEPLGNSGPSKEWDQNISQLLDSMYGAMRNQLKEGRKLSEHDLDRAMENAWFTTGADAIKLGLIDAEVDRLNLPDRLATLYPGPITYETGLAPGESEDVGIDPLTNPFGFLRQLMTRQDTGPTRDTIAILDIDGAIVDGESTPSSPFGGGDVGALTIRESLKEIEDEALIKGVIVRINSPGGSAIASESIWQGLRRVAEKKPVWVSVGSMAASGGYYLAVAGERIYLDPSSIVGSIGVVGGKLVMGGAYEKVHLNVIPRDRGPAASLMSTVAPWSDAQRAVVREKMTETYNLFVNRVKAGRAGIDIEKTAAGRLFAGVKAIEMGLADEIGGLSIALDGLADELQLEPDEYDVMRFPAPASLEETLQNLMGGFGLRAATRNQAAMEASNAGLDAAASLIRELVGPRAWPSLRDSIKAMWQMRREPVLLTTPRILIFR